MIRNFPFHSKPWLYSRISLFTSLALSLASFLDSINHGKSWRQDAQSFTGMDSLLYRSRKSHLVKEPRMVSIGAFGSLNC